MKDIKITPVSANLELIQAPNPPQDHGAESDGHIQGETNIRSGSRFVYTTGSVNQVNCEGGGEGGPDGIDAKRNPSVQVVESTRGTCDLVNSV